MCVLIRCIPSVGRNPTLQTVAPAESTWSNSGGNKWIEALQETGSEIGAQRAMRAIKYSQCLAGPENVNVEADPP